MSISGPTTKDMFLGGRLTLRQPAKGFRAGMDAVLLAAAAPVLKKGRLLDAGAGVGTAGLCYLFRVPRVELLAVELQLELAELARKNIVHNGFANRAEVVCADILEIPLPGNGFDLILTNPPWHRAEQADPSPNLTRHAANIERKVSLSAWLDICLRWLKQKGTLVLIHRAERLENILAALHGRVGEIELFPLWPGSGREAKLVLIRARKAVRGSPRLWPGLCLHEADGTYTGAVQAILRDGAPLIFGPS